MESNESFIQSRDFTHARSMTNTRRRVNPNPHARNGVPDVPPRLEKARSGQTRDCLRREFAHNGGGL
jgi:hypothetical protein